ncbi:hyaluronidase PH-20 [Tupaia chinensis]|uniref:hyaluronidase PH-20 n=1 Tax=Tupaia chinensis TaxID=246437 RepID=UPI0003C909FE|nr:hyaluronidase PH-20 [Tupaia chinensis]
MGVIQFKHIFLSSFIKSSKASLTVFTFLLIPYCLTQNFSALPILPSKTILWAWNAPSEVCVGNFNEPLDLSLFSLIGSPRKDAIDQSVTIFYADRLGLYPHIHEIKGTVENEGIPQSMPIQNHLDKAKKDIAYYIPTDKVGLAVIDWENWRPLWDRNWRPKDVYRNMSIALVQRQNTQMNLADATKKAKVDFEEAGKNFMLETLKLGRSLKPTYYWGYYLFPDCYNHNYKHPKYDGTCPPIERQRNDLLAWMWTESTALFPSIYLKSDLASSQKAAFFVRNRVQEAIRLSKVRNPADPLPVFVYTRLVFTDETVRLLSLIDLVHTFGETVALGASGIVIWGSMTLLRTSKSCLILDKYLAVTLNPYIINITLAAKLCSQVLCQDQGVCVRKDWNSSDYLHLNPENFDIQLGDDRKFIIQGKPTIEDLKEFSEKFDCSYYTNSTYNETVDIENIDAINVCVTESICIDTHMKSSAHPSTWKEKSSLISRNVLSSIASVIVSQWLPQSQLFCGSHLQHPRVLFER